MVHLTPNYDLSCFSDTYAEARRKLLKACQNMPSQLLQDRSAYINPLTGPNEEELYCDALLLGQSPTPNKLLVLVSGTHGVEGFTGSAIQTHCLPDLADVLLQNPDLGILIIHAFNPWGFAWLRRYDHAGIDLNRNFVDFSKPLPQNEDYDELHNQLLLVEGEQLQHTWQAIGLDRFVEIWTRGQYEHSNGFFFGGKGPSWSHNILQSITAQSYIEEADGIVVIDLHTGLGPYGYGEVINDHLPDTHGFQLVEQYFRHNAQSAHKGDSCSTVKDGLVDYHWHKVIGERGCFVTLEFGTYPITELIIHLVAEQHYWNLCQNDNKPRDIHHPAVENLKHFFYPQEKSWQQQVLFRARQVTNLALTGLTQ